MAKGNIKQQPHKLYHKHFKLLRGASTQAILKGQPHTLFRLPTLPNGLVREWPSGFPEVWTVRYEEDSVVWATWSKKLLDWLHDTGRSPYTAKQVYDGMQLFHIRVERPMVLDVIDDIWEGK